MIEQSPHINLLYYELGHIQNNMTNYCEQDMYIQQSPLNATKLILTNYLLIPGMFFDNGGKTKEGFRIGVVVWLTEHHGVVGLTR